jgi:riboflavin kinase/FMN adenylyltransferase
VNTVSFDNLPIISTAPSLVTIGTFDGVHLGHHKLLTNAVGQARADHLAAILLTFEPIPAQILRPEHFLGRICSAAEKERMLNSFGFDKVVFMEFDHALAAHTPEDFMAALVKATSLKELWIGESFALGKGRSGGVEQLSEIGTRLGYKVIAMPRVEDIDGVISSSRIRNAIQLGDVSLANRLLGRPVRIQGEVVQSAQFGRTIGFPTANIFPIPDQVPLADGIYASRVYLPEETEPRLSMTYVGTRPSVNTGARQIETNIFDFGGDLYGQVLAVDLLQRLRPDQYFPSIDALVAQLKQDEAVTREFFRELAEETTG